MVAQPLRGHTSLVWSVAYSSDGACIVSGSADGTIRIWDACTAQMTAPPLERDSHPVNSLTRWSLSEEGWVLTPELKRLIWVPPHLRDALLYPFNTLMISTRGFVKLDFSRANFGEDWRQCYNPS
ncbi:hypothetical protein FS749_003493 [Ceratobasidium sp. UAMH 11750]|nr:hypothetical protein FS749_003493 [Ceratobasidium sp. UAMH 11750]